MYLESRMQSATETNKLRKCAKMKVTRNNKRGGKGQEGASGNFDELILYHNIFLL